MTKFWFTKILVCPICHAGPGVDRRVYFVCRHRKWWKIRENIFILTKNKIQYADCDTATMNKILHRMKTEQWQDVIKSEIYSTNPYLASIIADENRADVSLLFDINPESRIADIGCGHGTLSVRLAKKAHVIAIDGSLERLQFLQERAKQEHVSNMVLACADACQLPLANTTLSGVFMIGVLEWLGVDEKNRNAVKQKQQTALSEACRVLKKGGFLCLAIENRYGIKYLLGSPEDHVGLPYIGLLKREDADVLCRLQLGDFFRNYTYGARTYRQMLTDAGFSSISFYYPYPDYKTFTALIPLDNPRLGQYYFHSLNTASGVGNYGEYIFHQAAADENLLLHLANSFVIVAKK